MSEVTIKIDGKEVNAVAGESVLNVARANGIYIPAICFLTRTSPSMACKLCMVEADGKRVYACNAKVKAGMNVVVDTPEIIADRKKIMEVYCVNHPLQCGVCDKSGECELQDNTMFQEVAEQMQAVQDTKRHISIWGSLKYDGALCIMCKRCTTVCSEMVGDNALTTMARGGESIDEELYNKDTMGKDPFGIWKAINKNLIDKNIKNPDSRENPCTDCGECAAVCPTGAMIPKDFQYTSNAWELESVPTTCSHCSVGCHIYYEVKHADIGNNERKIYRTKNDFNFQSNCGAGRFGYDFENRARRDENGFNKGLNAFKEAKTINFSSVITNEEALILQKLKEKHGYKLVNKEAKNYQNFLSEFSKTSGETLYSGSSADLHASNFFVSLGSSIKSDSPVLRYSLNNAIKMNKGAAIYFHPILDPLIDSMQKNILSVNHPAGKEEAVVYYLIDRFSDPEQLPNDIKTYLDTFKEEKIVTVEETVKEKVTKEDGTEEVITKTVSKEVTKVVNKLYDEMGVYITDAMEADIEKLIAKKDKYSLIVGEDVITHPRAKNIARLIGLLQRTSIFKVLIVPPKTNSLGVSLICDLDDSEEGYTVGYNADGDFRLTSSGASSENELDMPALNQQEGTFTNASKRVVTINPAVEYKGFTLAHFAKKLGLEFEYTVDFTSELPTAKGYQALDFDSLKNEFDVDGNENRGYVLEASSSEFSDEVETINHIEEIKGTLVYRCNPIKQFNEFTAKSTILASDPIPNGGWADNLYGSEEFLVANGLEDGDKVKVTSDRGEEELTVLKGDKIDGKIALVPNFLGTKLFTETDYRFKNVKIERVDI